MVRILRKADNRTLPIKTLRTAVGKAVGSDAAAVTEHLKGVIDHLITKGRVEMVGKNVTLLKQDKEKSAALLAAASTRAAPPTSSSSSSVGSTNKRKTEESTIASALEKKEQKRFGNNDEGATNAGDTGTRIFLGNLSFKIDEDKLKGVIPGITHIKWVTDKETQQFYGTAFVEFATPRDATQVACFVIWSPPFSSCVSLVCSVSFHMEMHTLCSGVCCG